ncbi:nuclear transport factor 2 family protein [Actinacidiphila guanduensis]|uniref:SnoaL-like domain-containing protein n=1 Tax=Actinacidiphila guanduensis TaxID=310781 RepID=A0A1H0PY47_9ACTN|nr:nuclear transport factor 2 family protein [Actinacidiphila guanduensis]SDP09359.1 SnoaL-like domain-containing protein [Actinacidiphila guanduensis]
MTDVVSDTERLVAVDAIREVMAWYVYYADHAEWGKLAGLFTPAASFRTYGPRDELYLDLTGPREIEDTIRGSVGNARAIHHLFSYTAEVQSTTSASIVVNMEDLITPPDDGSGGAVQLGDVTFTSVHGYGHYRCDLVKVEGTWKIDKLVQTRLRMDFAQ